MIPDLTKALILAFFRDCFKVCQNLSDCDDLDNISRSQVCQKQRLQLMFLQFSSNVIQMFHCCYIHLKIMDNMPCVALACI